MKTIWKIMLAVIAAVLLVVVTQPLWRYKVWMMPKSPVGPALPLAIRYDRLNGNIEIWANAGWKVWIGGQWRPDQEPLKQSE